jgi:hypothetical protein
MAAYWEWAKAEPAIQGINPWHWSDRISMSPTDGFARGAVSLGPELRQWYEWIWANVSQAAAARARRDAPGAGSSRLESQATDV